jgi:arabinogalactan oligomer/maltooligosaccharide transport system substrate-binding protein
MKKLRNFVLGACVGLTALSLASCKKEETGTFDLTVWGPTEQTAILKKLVGDFKTANETENLKFNIEVGVVSEADAYSQLQKDVTTGADVFAFPNDQLANLIRIGALSKLGGSNLDSVKSINGEGAVNAGKSGNSYYAYPYAADNGYFLYYDKSVYSETDVLKLDTVLDKAKEKGKQVMIDLDNSWYDAGFFFGAGCSYEVTYNDNAKEQSITCDFDSAKGLIAGKAMIAVANHEAFKNGDDDILKSGIGTALAAGVSGTWNAEAIKEKLGDNYAATKLPSFTVDGKDYQMSSFAGYKLMGVNPNSKSVKWANALALYLTGEQAQAYRYEKTGTGPTNKVVAQSSAVKSNIALAALAAQGAYAVAQTSVPSNYWSAVEAFGTEVVAKSVTADNLQAKLTQMCDLIKTIQTA